MPEAAPGGLRSRAFRQERLPHPAAFLLLHGPANALSSWLPFQAVDIGVGTFAVLPAQATVGEDEVLPVDRPVFQLSRVLRKKYKLKCAKTRIPGKQIPGCLPSTAPASALVMTPVCRGQAKAFPAWRALRAEAQHPAPPQGANLISLACAKLQLVACSRGKAFLFPSAVQQARSGDVAKDERAAIAAEGLGALGI